MESAGTEWSVQRLLRIERRVENKSAQGRSFLSYACFLSPNLHKPLYKTTPGIYNPLGSFLLPLGKAWHTPFSNSPQWLLSQTVAAAEPSVTLPASAALSGKLSSQQAVAQAPGQDAAVTAGFLLTGEGAELKRGLIWASQSKEDSKHLFISHMFK